MAIGIVAVFHRRHLHDSLETILLCILSSVDKALHSSSNVGYALPEPVLTNPLNIVMVNSQKVRILLLENDLFCEP